MFVLIYRIYHCKVDTVMTKLPDLFNAVNLAVDVIMGKFTL